MPTTEERQRLLISEANDALQKQQKLITELNTWNSVLLQQIKAYRMFSIAAGIGVVVSIIIDLLIFKTYGR